MNLSFYATAYDIESHLPDPGPRTSGGDAMDVRATTGAFHALQGPETFFPLAVICKKQIRNSNGSTESETVALSHIFRQECIPILQ